MPLAYTTADPFRTTQQTLAFGVNASGRTETSSIALELADRYPAIMATYRKLALQSHFKPGDLWLWDDFTMIPRIALMVVRETSVSATRPRYVDAVALRIARDYTLEGITSLAIAPLGTVTEQPSIEEALNLMLARSPLDVTVYRPR